MTLFHRLLAPMAPYPTSAESTFGPILFKDNPPDIIELLVTQSNIVSVRVFQDFRNYTYNGKADFDKNFHYNSSETVSEGRTQDMNSPSRSRSLKQSSHAKFLRFTILHARFFHISDNFLSNVVVPNHPNPPPDLIVSLNTLWYDEGCTTWGKQVCSNIYFPNMTITKNNMRATLKRHLKSFTNTIDTIDTDTVQYIATYPSKFIKEALSGQFTTIRHPQLPDEFTFSDHPSHAVGMGETTVWLHALLKDDNKIQGITNSTICTVVDGLGCFSIDAIKQGLYDISDKFDAPGFYGCSSTQCQLNITIPPIIHQQRQENINPSLREGGTHQIFALSASQEGRYVWIFFSIAAVLLFVFQECVGKGATHSMLGLGTVRIFASLHVVAGHLQRYGRDVMIPIPLAEFGFSWVPFFMMMSGFVLSWSKLNKPKKLPGSDHTVEISWHNFLRRRVLNIYPVYVAGILATITVSAKPFGTIKVSRFVVDFLLLQSWFPTWTENAIMPHTWFLSTVWPLWALHCMIYRFTVTKSTRIILASCGLVFAVPTIAFGVVPLLISSLDCWWCGHVHGRCEYFIDYIVILLKFHPVFYAPTYACGVASAIVAHRWRAQTKNQYQDSRWSSIIMGAEYTIKEYATTIGMMGLLISFSLAHAMHFRGAKLGFRLGMLMPFHSLVLIGLAVGSREDPIQRIAELRVFRCLGEASYSQYVFQFVWFHLWRNQVDAGFWPWCLAGSILIVVFVDRPCRRQNWLEGLFGGMIVSTVFISVIMQMAQFEVGRDVEISLSSLSDNGRQRWINPSVVWDNQGRLVVAARRHEIINTNENETIWYADVGLGILDPEKLQLKKPMKIIRAAGDNKQRSCINEKKLQETGILQYVVGQEDPRLIVSEQDNNDIFLTTVTYEKHGKECWARQTLGQAKEGAKDVLMKHNTAEGPSKNWMFVKDDIFMVNVTNQDVLDLSRRTGTTSPFSSQTSGGYNCTRNNRLSKKELRLLKNMHGGSNFVSGNSTVDGEAIFLAVVHTAQTYENYLVEFEKVEPFCIRRISTKIPLVVLQSQRNSSYVGGAFASGIVTLPTGGLLISYGASDYEARAFVLDQRGVAALFFSQSGVVSYIV
eukprot:CAMPEP_0198154480 /NCGR_PEP_ID=MMETSP1443-20131203/68618_1 /TAXON_ID=186043 /ORGANISM="Entomoneis sp., Strain CCMP2396" /LENGTH=1106 /DNA_ID=CAMNT_0043821159 /DNA_START=470 /DNA_END=3790 /DNA_ORIENTATION=-